MARVAFDIVLLRRLYSGEATVTIQLRTVARRRDAHQQLREDLEMMAWSLSQPVRLTR